MPIHNKIHDPNLKSLITSRIKKSGLSRPQLVKKLGYSNVSKGCRKLDTYLETLKSPTDQFIVDLLSALAINCPEFNRAMAVSSKKKASYERGPFHPYIAVLLGLQVRPATAWQTVHNTCIVPVSQGLLEKPFKEEMDTIFSLYLGHIKNTLNYNLKDNVIGFHYHREYDHYLKFNTDLVLKETICNHASI